LEAKEAIAEALVPYEDDSWVQELAYAQNAGAAVVYAIRCHRTADPQEAAWAARQVNEALFYWVNAHNDFDWNSPNLVELITADPLVQAELRRQRRDLEQLRATPIDQLSALARSMREIAYIEGGSLFGANALD
jgi:hypothetical protein